MSQPQQYTPATDFSQDETDAVSGRSTVRTAQLDAEFSSLQTSLNQAIVNLGVIQRDDTQLRDSAVTVASLSAAVLALITAGAFTVKGPWLTATAYIKGDLVTNTTGTYVCVVAHTSGVFATDLAAGKWATLFDSAAFPASAVVFTPTGTLSSVTVQAAIAEAASEALQKSQDLADLHDASLARTNMSVLSIAQIQNQASVYNADTGSADALVITPVPPVAAYTTGLYVTIKKSNAANTLTNPTLNVSGLGAKVIFKSGGLPLLVSDMRASGHYDFEYDGTYNSSAGGFELKNPTPPTVTILTPTSGFLRNRLINGGMLVDQLNVGAVVTVNSGTQQFGPDMVSAFGTAAAGVFTMRQLASGTPPVGHRDYLRFTATTADAAPAAGSFYAAQIRIEGLDVIDFALGTANATSFVLSMQMRSSLTGTFSGSFSNAANNRSYPWTCSIVAANTWTSIVVGPLVGDLAGTWAADNTTGLQLNIDIGCGSTYRSTAGTWQPGASAFMGVTGAVRLISTLNATLDIAGLQLEAGTSNTDFERAHFGDILRRCQRYVFKTFGQNIAPTAGLGVNAGEFVFNASVGGAAGFYSPTLRFPVAMRSTPTVTLYNPAASNSQIRDLVATADCSAAAVIAGADSGITFTGTGNVSTVIGNALGVHVLATARL